MYLNFFGFEKKNLCRIDAWVEAKAANGTPRSSGVEMHLVCCPP